MQNVVIIGASDKPDRYSYLANKMLIANGHNVFLVNPFKTTIDGTMCYRSVAEVPRPIDTITVYINSSRLKEHVKDIIELNPKRLIFNPGTEAPAIYSNLSDNGIYYIEACTLVLLRTGQFE